MAISLKDFKLICTAVDIGFSRSTTSTKVCNIHNIRSDHYSISVAESVVSLRSIAHSFDPILGKQLDFLFGLYVG